MLEESVNKLVDYIESTEHKGYDPYDVLNSFFNFKLLGKWCPILAIQFLKRNPINFRPLLGIKKGYNPKGMGLFLKAYCILFKKTGERKYIEKAAWVFDWLKDNYSKGYSGYAWGYNFDWASTGHYLKAYTPSSVVTSFVVDGVWEYYNITGDESAKQIIISAANYIRNDIPIVELEQGISFSYTHQQKDCCYNASLLAAEILAKSNRLEPNNKDIEYINKAINFVLSKQNEDGSWFYSLDIDAGVERKQIDFHQGFVIISLANLNELLLERREDITSAIVKGCEYYIKNQFLENGQSLWRIPKKWPVDIHNQSQGIITFAKLKSINPIYLSFSKKVSNWTIKNMQSKRGYFYFRKTRIYANRISYIRWNQAWMLLALATLIYEDE